MEELSPSSMLEIGAGPNPSVSDALINQYKIDYHLNDFSADELNKGDNKYLKIPGDFIALEGLGKYDIICSRMVLEHVEDAKAFHEKVVAHLNPGGIAIHFFATLYALPTSLNLLLPESWSDKLVKWGQGRDEEFHGKFPAKYDWCRGPIKGFNRKFEQLGYEVREHRGYVGHDYLCNQKLFYPLEKIYSQLLLKMNAPIMSSNAILVLQKK